MKGEVVNKLKYLRSHLEKTVKSIKIRCNRHHLVKTSEKILISSDADYENIIP